MALKRPFNEDDRLGLEEVPAREPKRRHSFATCVVCCERCDERIIDPRAHCQVRTFSAESGRVIVREEVEHVIQAYMHPSPRPSLNQAEESMSRGWQLHFTSRLPQTLFTGKRIEAEDNKPVQIVILDANSKRIVNTGPLSSIKIDILVLDGDFGSDDQENWSEKEFDTSVIREREGKRPLVTGNLIITLRDGAGSLGDIAFTDNSSWIRSRTFRLGARVIRSTCIEERIREARSGAFIVKDHRVESYQKHYPPSLGDEVWRLEKIRKDGAFHKRLVSNGINTVQDFLRLGVTDHLFLRTILGRGMLNKIWDAIFQHATSCILDNKCYMYYNAQWQAGLLLNSIYNVVGVAFDGQSYQSLDNLTIYQKNLVDGLKKHAYRNLKDLVEIDPPSVEFSLSSMALPIENVSFPGSSLDVKLPNISITHQDQLTQLDYNNPTGPLPSVLEDHGQVDGTAIMQGYHLMPPFSQIQSNNFKTKGSLTTYANDGNEWTQSGSSGPVVQDSNLIGCDVSQIQMQNWFPGTTTWGQGNRLLLASSDEAGAHTTKACRPNIGWFKLRAAIKWVISIRRDLAARRRAKLLPLDY